MELDEGRPLRSFFSYADNGCDGFRRMSLSGGSPPPGAEADSSPRNSVTTSSCNFSVDC